MIKIASLIAIFSLIAIIIYGYYFDMCNYKLSAPPDHESSIAQFTDYTLDKPYSFEYLFKYSKEYIRNFSRSDHTIYLYYFTVKLICSNNYCEQKRLSVDIFSTYNYYCSSINKILTERSNRNSAIISFINFDFEKDIVEISNSSVSVQDPFPYDLDRLNIDINEAIAIASDYAFIHKYESNQVFELLLVRGRYSWSALFTSDIEGNSPSEFEINIDYFSGKIY